MNSASTMNAPIRAINITRKEKEYKGMLEYKEGDENRLLKNLVVGRFQPVLLKQIVFGTILHVLI